MFYRHGDLMLHPTEEVKGEKVASKKYVLAVGEHTTHKHVIEGDVTVYKDTDGSIFLTIGDKTVLSHEEHNTLTIEPGTYKLGHEREFDYFKGEIERVQD